MGYSTLNKEFQTLHFVSEITDISFRNPHDASHKAQICSITFLFVLHNCFVFMKSPLAGHTTR